VAKVNKVEESYGATRRKLLGVRWFNYTGGRSDPRPMFLV
jgi:hypothetical protein